MDDKIKELRLFPLYNRNIMGKSGYMITRSRQSKTMLAEN